MRKFRNRQQGIGQLRRMVMGGGKIQLRIDCGDVADYFGRWRNIMAAEVESRVEPPEQEEGEQNSPFGLAWWLLEHKARAFYGLPDRRKGERYFFFRLGQVEAKVVVNTILDVLNDLKALPEGTKITCDELKAKVNEYFKTELASVDSERGFRRPTTVDTNSFPLIPKVEVKKTEALPVMAPAAGQPAAILVTPEPLREKPNGPLVRNRALERLEPASPDILEGVRSRFSKVGSQPPTALGPDADEMIPSTGTAQPVEEDDGQPKKNVRRRISAVKAGPELHGTPIFISSKGDPKVKVTGLVLTGLGNEPIIVSKKQIASPMVVVVLDGPDQGLCGKLSSVSDRLIHAHGSDLWRLNPEQVSSLLVLANKIRAVGVPRFCTGSENDLVGVPFSDALKAEIGEAVKDLDPAKADVKLIDWAIKANLMTGGSEALIPAEAGQVEQVPPPASEPELEPDAGPLGEEPSVRMRVALEERTRQLSEAQAALLAEVSAHGGTKARLEDAQKEVSRLRGLILR